MTPYHDRMPVLLRAEDFDAWLNGSLGADALRPAAESALREWPVSRRMNRTGVGDDDPTIIEKVDAAYGPEAEFSAALGFDATSHCVGVWVKIRVPEK